MPIPTPLEERSVELHLGTRSAIATLQRGEKGWFVDVIAENDKPDIAGNDQFYSAPDKAVEAAKTLWLS